MKDPECCILLCRQHHFTIVFPLNSKLEALVTNQVQHGLEVQLIVLEEDQVSKNRYGKLMVNSLMKSLGKFVTEGQGHGLWNEGEKGLHFMDAIMSGLKVATLVDISLTHIFLSE